MEVGRTTDWGDLEHHITAKSSGFGLNISELIQYKDLLIHFVKRDFVTLYKQTVLGPLWYVIQPVLMTLTFSVIFGSVAGIATDGVPKLPFYLAGIVFWNYFSESLLKVSDTFFTNQKIFGKVYFPRIIVPLSLIVSNGLKLVIQFLLFAAVLSYFVLTGEMTFTPSWVLVLLPLFVLCIAMLSLSFGMIITAMTARYRDLKFLLQFGVQLLMYASPIVYPLSMVEGKWKLLILANPMSSIIEGVKQGFFGVGSFQLEYFYYTLGVTIISFLIALKVFGSTERTFVDTI